MTAEPTESERIVILHVAREIEAINYGPFRAPNLPVCARIAHWHVLKISQAQNALETAKTALDEADKCNLALQARVDALKRYANHMNYCATIELLGCVDETICEIKCNCGLTDLLKGQS